MNRRRGGVQRSKKENKGYEQNKQKPIRGHQGTHQQQAKLNSTLFSAHRGVGLPTPEFQATSSGTRKEWGTEVMNPRPLPKATLFVGLVTTLKGIP